MKQALLFGLFAVLLVGCKQHEVRLDETKAFAEASFGMPIEEVSRLPHFNNYIKDGSSLLINNERIGKYEYRVKLLFGNDDELYLVTFSTTENSTEDFFNTYTKQAVLNFSSVIRKKYGEPNLVVFAYPQLSEMEDGYYMQTEGWEIGKKVITVGVARQGREYFMFSRISDAKREREQSFATNRDIIESSKLF